MRDYLQDYVSTQKPGVRNNSGIGSVILHGSRSREEYISDCTLKGCVTIALTDGGFVENVLVLKHVWNDIVFPAKKENIGSSVLWNKTSSNMIVIVGVIPNNNELINRNENDFVIGRNFTQVKDGVTTSNRVEVSGNAKAGKLNVTVDGGDDSGELMINVFNKKKTGKLSINLKGNINVDASDSVSFNIRNKIDFSIDDKKTNFYYEKEKGFYYKDEFSNELIFNKDNIQLISGGKKINLGNGKEPILLGKTTVQLISNVLDAIMAITTPTVLGSSPIINVSSFIPLRAKLKTLKSKYSFTD